MPTRWDKQGVAKCIDALWERPDEVRLREEIAAWIGYQRGKLLDVGCGSARIAPLLVGCKYIGLDPSKEMLALTPATVETRLGSGSKLPFEDKSIPTGLCTHVFRHLSAYQPLLSELARVVSERIFLVDVFGGDQTTFGEVEVCGQKFLDNSWRLHDVLEDIKRLFPGWSLQSRGFITPLIIGLKLEAPKG
jgi:ubiquinone/menaquinone biosynthesis C-methylase UbiE